MYGIQIPTALIFALSKYFFSISFHRRFDSGRQTITCRLCQEVHRTKQPLSSKSSNCVTIKFYSEGLATN